MVIALRGLNPGRFKGVLVVPLVSGLGLGSRCVVSKGSKGRWDFELSGSKLVLLTGRETGSEAENRLEMVG